jgi:6-phosphogluconolactonase (cycloisomerase 2 family)
VARRVIEVQAQLVNRSDVPRSSAGGFPAQLAAALCLSASLAACGGGGGGATGSTSTGTLGASAPTRFLYASTYPTASALSFGGIYGFRFDTGTGKLTTVSSAAFANETIGAPIALSRDSKYLYSIDLLTDPKALAVYAVQPDGWLMPVAGQPFGAGEPIATVATDPAADFLFATAVSGNLQVWSIDPSTGALTQRSAVNGLTAGGSALVTPNGRYLYDATPNGIYEFAIDAASGGLTQLTGSPVAYHIVPGPAAVDPAGKFVYVTNADPSVTSGAQVSAWSIDQTTGELGAIALSPTAITGGPQLGVTVDGSGTFAIVTTAAGSSGCFYVFSIDATTGALTPVPGSPFANGDCGQIAPDVSYNYLYDGSSAGLAVYLLSQQGVPQSAPRVVVIGGQVMSVAVSH